MKHNKKNTDRLLFLLLSPESQCEKKILRKKLFVSEYFTTISTKSKEYISSKSIFILLASDKKAKTTSLNV